MKPCSVRRYATQVKHAVQVSKYRMKKEPGQELSFIYSLSIWYTQSFGTLILQKIKKKHHHICFKMLLNCNIASILYAWYPAMATEKSHLSTE